jgi:hypothetical protein
MSNNFGRSGDSSGTKGKDETPEDNHVIDFTQVRAQKLEEKRRKTERIFFKQLLGIYSVTNNEDARQIEIVDVSEEGISFQVPFNSNDPWPRDKSEVPIRLYFSQDTYLPITLQIQNSRPYIENGVRFTRYGCKVDNTLTSYVAYLRFVQFLKTYAEHAHKDTGKVSFFYL